MKLELPDKRSILNRLIQDADGHIRLRDDFLATLANTDQSPPTQIPMPVNLVLDDVIQMIGYMNSLQMTAPCNPELGDMLERLAARIIDLANSAPDGVIASVMLGPRTPYTACHAIYCTLLGARLARPLHYSEEETQQLTRAMLGMNLGAWQLQNFLIHQKEPLSDQQRQEIQMHPLISSALMRHGGMQDARLHQLVLTHHEAKNGHGYPFGFIHQTLPALLPALQLVDRFVALLMPRRYRKGIETRTALATLYKQLPDETNQALVAVLIREIGIYPPGCFVKLESGQTTLVVETTSQANCPHVMLPTSKERISTNQDGYRITGSVPINIPEAKLSLLAPLWSTS